MQILFSAEFFHNQLAELFTVYQLSDNLFEAKSTVEIIILWKNNTNWEGVTNVGEPVLIEHIGKAIDSHFGTGITSDHHSG